MGVAFYLMLALRTFLRDQGWFDERGIAIPNLAELLDLVALGTVADVVPLDANNRILTWQGMSAYAPENAVQELKRCWKWQTVMHKNSPPAI